MVMWSVYPVFVGASSLPSASSLSVRAGTYSAHNHNTRYLIRPDPMHNWSVYWEFTQRYPSLEYWHDGGLPAGGERLTTTSTGATAGVGYPEGGVEAMTGQSTLTPARSEENEELHAGSPQPLLQPQAANAASVVAWEALTSLRTSLPSWEVTL